MNRRSATAYLGTHLLNAPLFAIYGLLAFILCKDLGASDLQITVLIALKPIVAIFSSYWSSYVANRPDLLKWNVVWATVIGIVPTLLFPFFGSNWFFIGAFATYFFTERAVIPAWMELLKIDLDGEALSRVVGRGSLINFIAAGMIPLLIAPLLDQNIGLWKGLFVAAAGLSLSRLGVQALIAKRVRVPRVRRESHLIIRPWKSTYQLLRRRPDFALYQLIFFFGGLGIMVTQPALPQFVEKILHLSYTELALAFALFKAVGFVVTNPLWARWIHRTDLFRFCAVVTLAAAASMALILLSPYTLLALYAASFCYGLMQAGSQLSWQMAGPIFAGGEDSSPYTSTNVILVGVRGCIGPFLGGLLVASFGLQLPYVVGAALCLVGCGCGFVGSAIRGRLAQSQQSV